jgi:hypothetical protein
VPDVLVRRLLPAVADVRGHGAREEYGLLRDEADPRAQICLRHLAHVNTIHQHAPLIDVVEPRNQPRERRLARARAADDRGDLAGMRHKRHTGECGLLGARILKGYVLELDVTALGGELGLHGPRGIDDLGRHVEHFVDPCRRRRRAWQHHEHGGDHEHREENLHGVLKRRNHRAHLHRAGVDPVAAEPDDRDAREVQHHDERGQEERDQTVQRNRRVRQIKIRLIESLALMHTAIERADHADAAQPLAEHKVQTVDLCLHRLRQGNRAAHDESEDERHHRHDSDEHPRKLRVLRKRKDDAANRHHGRRDHHSQHHDEHLLHLGRVVGRPRHERRRTEAVELVDRKVFRAREDRAAQNPPESGRYPRRVIAPGDGTERGDDGHQQHQAPGLEDRALIAFHNALVHDVRHQSRQEEKAERLREGQNQDHRDVSPIGLDETKQFQHGGNTERCELLAARRDNVAKGGLQR